MTLYLGSKSNQLKKKGAGLMYCRNCGTKLPDGEVVCPNCGTSDRDSYMYDILPEINDERCQIPKDTIAKTIGIILAVVAAAVWLVFFA